MKKSIYYSLMFLTFLLFVIINFSRDRISKNHWEKEVHFVGIIQEIVHIKHEKGSYFKINDEWWVFSYDRLYEEQNFVGYRIEKRINEVGVWIEKSVGSNEMQFNWSRGHLVKNKKKLRILNQNIENRKK